MRPVETMKSLWSLLFQNVDFGRGSIARVFQRFAGGQETNHSTSGALKNAIDYLHREWNNMVAGFVSYGGHAGGARAVEHLRLILAEVMVATVRAQVLSLFTDFESFRAFRPGPQREKELHAMLDQLVAWGGALMVLRLEAAEEGCGGGRVNGQGSLGRCPARLAGPPSTQGSHPR